MLFCTYEFVVFLAFVLAILKLSEDHPKLQQLFLLVASNVFYGLWDWRFLALIWFSTLLDFGVGMRMSQASSTSSRKRLLACSIVGNIGVLGLFKYFDFFQQSTRTMLAAIGWQYQPWLLDLALPVGISFYTFQTLAYTIDVYRKQAPACTDLLVFGQYVCYFPQLVAGPIERAERLIPQLSKARVVGIENVLSGLLLILWGSLKKATVADSLGLLVVDPLFGDPVSGTHLLLAIVAFSIQIYCDFSGYCDIARGTSRCMGVELVENFHAPYFASSISAFWRRWHMSLSQWFKDYLYIGLGGNRRGKVRTIFNLWITMFLCGLWHGANATFLLWGGYHGALLMAHRLVSGSRRKDLETWGGAQRKIVHALKVCGTLLLVGYGWLIFRLDSIAELLNYSLLLLDPLAGFIDPVTRSRCFVLTGIVVAAAGVLWCAHWLQVQAVERGLRIEDIPHISPQRLGVGVAFIGLVVVLFSSFGKGGIPFIYFQF